jgi:hypothetical protein
MKNTEVFNDYDMVVSVTEDTINAQLKQLVKMGTINPEFILIQEIEGGEYRYQVADSISEVPVDSQGNPKLSYIDGQIMPQVQISQSGTDITFVLEFLGGSAYFWTGYGPAAQLTKYDMTGWSYGVDITLDLAAVEKDDIGQKIAVPKNVEEQLKGFLDNMFSVSSLFMDFEATELVRFHPAHSGAGDSGDAGLQQLVLFMNFYLKDLQAQGNPYILGYALAPGANTQYPPREVVPDELAPVGTTYTMYHDPDHPGLSTLNFVLATKGGHGAVTGTPGTFDTNWINPTEQCDAKMIYSHGCLIEPFILRPFFEQLRQTVWTGVSEQFDELTAGNDYATGRSSTPGGLAFTISNVGYGDQRYVNTFNAKLTTTAAPATAAGEGPSSSAIVQLSGHLGFYKEVSTDMGCTATAWASQSGDWDATIQVDSAKDAQGLPTLTIKHSAPTPSGSSSDTGKNDCAKGWEVIGEILDLILAGFTLGLSLLAGDGGPLDAVFDLTIPGLGNLGHLFDNLGSSVTPAVILPAGNEFFFKNPAIDAGANLSAELTYKAED